MHLKPAIWRQILVPGSIRLPKLHVVLLWAMGWDGGHLPSHEEHHQKLEWSAPPRQRTLARGWESRNYAATVFDAAAP
jgi:hypothetical protein